MNHSFDIDLASEVGVEAAIIFSSIEHWIDKHEKNGENIRDGRVWMYNSRKAWQELFPYLGEKQIRNALTRLAACGMIETGNYSYGPLNRTTWYCLAERAKLFGRKGQPKFGPKGQTINSPHPVKLQTPPKAPAVDKSVDKSGVLKSKDLGQGRFDIIPLLTEAGLQAARRAAPDWDIYQLASVYNAGVSTRGKPDHPDKAFAAWCRKYTKGIKP